MFSGDSALTNLDISGSNFDTSKVTNMQSMFANDNSLTNLNVSKFNTSNVTNMWAMFNNDSSLTSLKLPNFDTDNVTNMWGMFSGDSSLTSLDISNFNTGHVINMQYMFANDNSLTSLNLSSNFYTNDVTDMSYMFSGDSGLTNLDVSKFNTSKVTNMKQMFNGDSNLTSLNISNFDTSNVTDMSDMLDASSLEKLTLGEKTKLANTVNLPSGTWHKQNDISQTATLDDNQPHVGTWIRTDGTVTLKFVNAKHTDKVLYTSDALPGSTSKPLDLTDSTVKSTYITPNIPTGYTYATATADLYGNTQPQEAEFKAAGNTVTIYLIGDPETNVTVKYELKNGNQVGDTITPTGNRVGDTLDLSQNGTFIAANPIPNGYEYATSPDDMPADYIQPGVITYGTEEQDKVIYVVGKVITASNDLVKVIHYYAGTITRVKNMPDYTLGTVNSSRYGDVVSASGTDPQQAAPKGYVLDNQAEQKRTLTPGVDPQQTIIFYYSVPKAGSGNNNPYNPQGGTVDIPQGTDLSGDSTYAGDAIKNKDQLPGGTTYTWNPAPDTSTKGTSKGFVTVTYPDGTYTSVPVTVNIVDKKANGNGNNTGTAEVKTLQHNAYLYDKEGKRANAVILKTGSQVNTYGTTMINGRKFFNLNQGFYLAAGNVLSKARKLIHNAYVYNKYGQRANKQVLKRGNSIKTYGIPVIMRGKLYYAIGNNHFVKINNCQPRTNNYQEANADTGTSSDKQTLLHNAYLYDDNGQRANQVILKAKSKVGTNRTKTINGRKFYVLANVYYLAAGNIDAINRKLTHNTHIYSQYGNRLDRKVLKQGKSIPTYGDPVAIHGKAYYIVDFDKYLKRANF